VKSTTQLKEARGERIDALESIVTTAEGREMSDDENTRSEEIMNEVEDLDKQILRSEKLEKTLKREAVAVAPGVSTSSSDEMQGNRKGYDIGKAIREAGRGNLSGLEAEMHQEAQREFREAGVSPSGTLQIPIALMEKRANTVSSSSNVVGQSQQGVLAGLVPDSLLERAGANRITGVAGSVLLPSLPTNATSVVGEVITAGASDAMSGVKIDPVKMASMITISQQALNMSSGAFDSVVANQFRKHSGALIDEQFFKNVIATGTYMKRKETAAAVVAGLGFQNINGLIAAIGDANGLSPDAKFFGSHASMAEARVTEAVLNSGVGILQGDKIAGYEALASSLCNAGLLTDTSYNTYNEVYNTAATTNITNEATLEPVFLANMADTYVCYWGGADLVVDEYTSAHLGITRLIMNVYANAKTGHAASAGYFVSDPV